MSSPVLPHHDGSALYVSTQTPQLNETVTLRLRVPQDYPGLKKVLVRSNPDHEPHWDIASHIGSADGWSWWQTQVRVANPRHGYRWLLVHDDDAPGGSASTVEWLNQAGVHTGEVLDADDFSLLAHPAPPDWLHDSVMYQIFPDRFARSSAAASREQPDWAEPAQWDDPVNPVMPSRVCQLYGGDLDGVVERLDHLQQLGVNILYLTPFFPGASNHRYDASSFDRVDPLLGGEEALIRLTAAAHARGMKVIGDLTTNHSGDGHEWFRRAAADPDCDERSYYYFNDDGTYESWLGTATLPKFDWSSPKLRKAFIQGPDSVVAKWLKPPFDLDGWRIDVANMTGRLRDVDLNAEVRQILRRTMEEVKPDSILLAESTNDAASDLTGDAWHGAMTYPSFTRPLWAWLAKPTGAPYITGEGSLERTPWFFGQPIGGIPQGSAEAFREAVDRFNAPIPWRIRLGNMHPLDTHDTARFATHADTASVGLAVGLQMSLPGLPTLFAGDEFGLTGEDGEISRTPLPWSALHEPRVAIRIGVYQELIALRRQHPALSVGGIRWLYSDEDTLIFIRESQEESVLALASSSANEKRIVLPAIALPGVQARKILGNTELRTEGEQVEFLNSGAQFALWLLPGVVVPSTD